MKPPRRLRGITWDHTRGLLPLQAAAQRFHERHPEVEVVWEKRSLQAFADQPLQALARSFDLLVIDHPFVGHAAAHGVLLPLDRHLPRAFLRNQAARPVGASHRSYAYGGHQWALAIDAAAPVACWRADLLLRPPRTWAGLMTLARRGRVAVPGKPVDSLMNFYMLCLACGEEPFRRRGHVVGPLAGSRALEQLRALLRLCDPACLEWNPIQTFEALCARDDLSYCPFAYGYSNYAREGYARRRLRFGDVVDRMATTLGGTGLAVSAASAQADVAVQFAAFVGGADFQRTLYAQSGGQPGHRDAWEDPENNRWTNGYFRATLPVLDRAWVRPRHDGYLAFQDAAGPVVHEYLRRGGEAARVIGKLDELYARSLSGRALRKGAA